MKNKNKIPNFIKALKNRTYFYEEGVVINTYKQSEKSRTDFKECLIAKRRIFESLIASSLQRLDHLYSMNLEDRTPIEVEQENITSHQFTLKAINEAISVCPRDIPHGTQRDMVFETAHTFKVTKQTRTRKTVRRIQEHIEHKYKKTVQTPKVRQYLSEYLKSLS